MGLVPRDVVIVAIDIDGKAFGIEQFGYVNPCILLFLFIMQTLNFITKFIFCSFSLIYLCFFSVYMRLVLSIN